MIPVLHNDRIHYPTEPVTESPGRPGSSRIRSVVCPCGHAGTMPSEGWVDDTVKMWARINHYDVEQDADGRWCRVA